MKFFLFLIFIFFSLGFRFFLFDFFLISNSEMLPTLLKNDYVGVQKYPYSFFVKQKKVLRGDVVLIQLPSQTLEVRRIIGLPKDRIFYSDGILYINEKSYRPRLPEDVLKKERDFLRPVDFTGEEIQEVNLNDLQQETEYEHWQEDLEQISYSILLKKGVSLDFGPYQVPDNHYFVMGDHRMASRDSRTWAVRDEGVQGEVIFSRKDLSQSDVILIPQGTQIIVERDPYFPLFFTTVKETRLEGKEVKVLVQSKNQGLRGNVNKWEKWTLPQEFRNILNVRNDKFFFGGQDKSVIPLDSIKGKVVVVLWGCEKPVEFLSFLCHFNSFRKGRWFWSVHK